MRSSCVRVNTKSCWAVRSSSCCCAPTNNMFQQYNMTSAQEYTTTVLANPTAQNGSDSSDCEVHIEMDVEEEPDGSQTPVPDTTTTERKATMCKKRPPMLYMWFIIVVFGLLELCFVTRGVLLVARYATPGDLCTNVSNSNSSNFSSQHHLKHSEIFTTTMYGMCSILRCIEYLLLAHGFYTFVSNVESNSYRKDIRLIVLHALKKLTSFWGFVFLLLIPTLLLLSVGIPIVGIVIELEYTQRMHCEKHNSRIFIAYCAFNIGRYLVASCVRLTMAIASIEVSRIWSVDSLESDTDAMEDIETNNIIFLSDWTASSKNHDKLSQQYDECGKKSQQVGEIFKTWFIVPWITFFIATSIKTKNVLSPWLQVEEEKEVDKELLPAIYYMMYNIFQVISLLVAYISALKMNTHHHTYYTTLRKKQLNTYESSISRQALARILYIEKKENYDFVPHVAFTHIRIHMDSPLYVIFLLLGVFFAICGALY